MIPLSWERLLWSGRPRRLGARIGGTRFVLTDFRLARVTHARVDDIAIHDIADVHRIRTPFDRLFGTSTLVVDSRHRHAPSLVVAGVARGAQLAALLELLASDPRAAVDPERERAIRDALEWEPRLSSGGRPEALAVAAIVAIAIAAVAIGVSGHARPVAYSPLDPIAPDGHKRSRDEIVRFMETTVMPWARGALGPIRGGRDRVTCETCHGSKPEARGWQMPAVAVLPAPIVRDLGWERNSNNLDPQVRNAIYGYLADADKQTKATYMREVVLPGMAALLHRPAYDFTRPYEENRARHAFGCYHCHRVK